MVVVAGLAQGQKFMEQQLQCMDMVAMQKLHIIVQQMQPMMLEMEQMSKTQFSWSQKSSIFCLNPVKQVNRKILPASAQAVHSIIHLR